MKKYDDNFESDEPSLGDDAQSPSDLCRPRKTKPWKSQVQTPPKKEKQLTQAEIQKIQLRRQADYNHKMMVLRGKRPTGNLERAVDPHSSSQVDGLSPDDDIIPTKPGTEVKSRSRLTQVEGTYGANIVGIDDDVQGI